MSCLKHLLVLPFQDLGEAMRWAFSFLSKASYLLSMCNLSTNLNCWEVNLSLSRSRIGDLELRFTNQFMRVSSF